MSNNKIFVSYRRQDASGEAGRLVDNLEDVFGAESVFLDVETLEAGLDFVQAIDQALNSCKVLIAIIGPHWANIKDTDGNLRLFNDGDFIRIEIGAALKRDIRVIPVLVNGARMPADSELPEDLKALNRRHAHELSSSRWKYDSDQLIEVLSKIIEPKKKQVDPIRPRPIPPQPKPKGWFAKNYLWVLGIFVVLIILISLGGEDTDIPTDYNTQTTDTVTESSDFADIPLEEQTQSAPNSEPEASPSILDVTGNWTLSLGNEVSSFLQMSQIGSEVEFVEYNLFNVAVGQGVGFWEDEVLYLDYYNSLMDMSGEIELEPGRSGGLAGTLYIPFNNSTSPISLQRSD